MANDATVQDAKSRLGHVGHIISEALGELEVGACQIDEIAAALRGAGNLLEEDEQLADALSDLRRDLFHHAEALRRAMDAVFEDEDDR
jgi:hypothetical protein